MPEICASVLTVSFLAEIGLRWKIENLVSLSKYCETVSVLFFFCSEF